MGIFKTEEETNFDGLKNKVNQSRLPDGCKAYLKEYIEKVKTKKEKNPFLEFTSFETMILNIASPYSTFESKEEVERSINNIKKAMETIKNTNKDVDYLGQVDFVLYNFSGEDNKLDFDNYLYNILGPDKYWKVQNIARTNNLTNEALENLELLIDEISFFIGDTNLLGNFAINYLNKYNNILEGKEEHRKELIKQVKQANGVYDFSQKDLEYTNNLVEQMGAEKEETEKSIEVLKKLKSQITKALQDAQETLYKLNNTISNGEKIIDEKIDLAKQALESSAGRIEQDIKTRAEEYIQTVIKIAVENAVTELQNNKKSVLTPDVIETLKVIKENQTYIVDNIANHVISEKIPEKREEPTPVVVSGTPQTTIVQQTGNDYFIEPNEDDIVPPIYIKDLIVNLRRDTEREKIINDRIEKLKSEGEFVHKVAADAARELLIFDKIPYLWGPSQSGKSYVAEQVLKILYGDPSLIHIVEKMDSDIIGSYLSINGKFVPNNIYIAMKYGHPFLLEEMDNWNPDALKHFTSFYETPLVRKVDEPYNKNITVPFANLLKVSVNPNSRIIGTGNTCGDGMKNGNLSSNPFDTSVLQRLVQIYVDYDSTLEKNILKEYPEWYKFTQKIREQTEYYKRDNGKREVLDGYVFTTADASIINDSLNEKLRTPYDLVKYYIVKNNNNGNYLNEIVNYCEKLLDKTGTSKDIINAKTPSEIQISDIAYLYIEAAKEQQKILQKR